MSVQNPITRVYVIVGNLVTYFGITHCALFPFFWIVSRPVNTTCPDSGVVTVTSETGHLASITSDETGLGTTACPWHVQVPPYQRINVTVVDYTVPASREWNSGYASWEYGSRYTPTGSGSQCDVEKVLGVISETFVVSNVTNTTVNTTFCTAGRRDSLVYSSEGSAIVIALSNHRKSKGHFLIKIQGTVSRSVSKIKSFLRRCPTHT